MGKQRYTGGQLTAPSDELLEKLRRLYSGSALERDALGRRNALPSEIQQAIRRTGNRGR